jgi:acetyltransferase-like isoleucine patch superfamily enzyme
MATHTLHQTLHQVRLWMKHSSHPLARRSWRPAKATRAFELPVPRPLCAALYALYGLGRGLVCTLTRVLWWTPLFKGRVAGCGRGLYLYGGLPLVTGPVQIEIGEGSRISGQTTFSGRTCAPRVPRLEVGDNVDIGWMTTIAVATTVRLGNNVRIAGRTLLAGYPGHPLHAGDRAAGLPDTEAQVGDIVLEDDVWLATGVSVMAGVLIGRGTVVAAGSVVTADLPAGVLAGGVPARVIRSLDTFVSER